ncbi:uncharacterized protein LOC106157003 [Lingula anatina]|uniref:Uncharacterized protein LOC106157003 n=1 Tax=Lingula anatina TaxID=7574 RepID=A0A1S3HPF9_LINAN|nr:uncharacterized protein LOC106157003 [Lingula anatina]|eukprot:XP_013387920.1 uncharacterized protein LOC106157003 [Lingula anatina]
MFMLLSLSRLAVTALIIQSLAICMVWSSLIPSPPGCSIGRPMKDLDINQFVGKWYGIAVTPLSTDILGTWRNYQKYISFIDQSQGGPYVGVNKTSSDGYKNTCTEDYNKFYTTEEEGIFARDDKADPDVYVLVIDTDYNNYALTHEYFVKLNESLFGFYSRECVPRRSTLNVLKRLLDRDPCLQVENFIKVEHVGCEGKELDEACRRDPWAKFWTMFAARGRNWEGARGKGGRRG